MTDSSAALAAVLERISQNQAASIGRLETLLRLPSVSADPGHAADVRTAAEWVRAELAALGFDAEIRETAGHPAVVAQHPGPGPGAPRVLIYSHYDVQPAEPLELWNTPPFSPAITPGPNGPQIFARGASDDKGQLISWLDAVRAIIAVTGTLPVAMRVLVEGEEEIGSPHLLEFLEANADGLQADVAILNDASMWSIDRPALVTRLRGMLYTQIDMVGPNRDVHSGLYGGLAVNPLQALSALLGRLHDENRRITIPGFYDRVIPPSAEEHAIWQGLGFNEAQYLADIGLETGVGEAGFSALDCIWARPTAEINGIWGGYSGAGSKTVIPAEAHAKVSFRLVPGQDPQEIRALFAAYIEANLPPGVMATVTVISASKPTLIPSDSRYVKLARQALETEFGQKLAIVGTGGTLPVVNAVRQTLGIDSLLYGWAQNDDNPHSPNEKFELTCLEKGSRAHARLLFALADIDNQKS